MKIRTGFIVFVVIAVLLSENLFTACSSDGAEMSSLVTPNTQWVEKTYTVVFDANGGKGAQVTQVFAFGEEKKLTANAYDKENYKFLRWNTKIDGSGKSYADEEMVKDLVSENGGSIILYAQWEFNADMFLLGWMDVSHENESTDGYIYDGSGRKYTFTIHITNKQESNSPVMACSIDSEHTAVKCTPVIQTIPSIEAKGTYHFNFTVSAEGLLGGYIEPNLILSFTELATQKKGEYKIPVKIFHSTVPLSLATSGPAEFMLKDPDGKKRSILFETRGSKTVHVPDFTGEKAYVLSVQSASGCYYTFALSETVFPISEPTNMDEINACYSYGGDNHVEGNAFCVNKAFQAYCGRDEIDWYSFIAQYDVPASVAVSLSQISDISLTYKKDGTAWIFTAEEGCKTYMWAVDGVFQSAESNVFTLETAGMKKGVYEVTVEVEKDGAWYSATAKVTVGGN